MKKIVFLSLLIAGTISQSVGQKKSLDRVIAKVDNYIVLLSDLELTYLQLVEERRIPANRPEYKCQVLQTLVINKLFMAKAEIDSVTIDDRIIDLETDQRIGMMLQGQPIKKLEELYGKKIDAIKAELRSSLKEDKISRIMRDKITTDVTVTPSEVRRFFERIPSDSLPPIPSELEVGQIVRVATIDKSEKERIRNKMEELRKRIVEKGEKFEDLAYIYCEDDSRNQGGDLGWQRRGNFVPEFEAAAFKLKPGEVSKVVETQFGYHLIRLEERRGEEFRCRHILMMPDWSRADIEPAKKFLDSLAQMIRLDSISFQKAAIEYSEDKGGASTNTANNGGMFVGEDGSTRLSGNSKALDSFVFFAVDTMKVGNISKPLAYRTPDGKKAMRILYLKARYPAHIMNLKDDYQKLYMMALNEKKNDVLMRWFLKAKNDVYVEIDEEFKKCNVLGL